MDVALRDQFAVAALNALIQTDRFTEAAHLGHDATVEQLRPFAKQAWMLADAMIAERESTAAAMISPTIGDSISR